MISCYDQRPISEIKADLLSTPSEEIDLVDVCAVLCDRIASLENVIKQGVAVDAEQTQWCTLCKSNHPKGSCT